jgi:hypothetical protein
MVSVHPSTVTVAANMRGDSDFLRPLLVPSGRPIAGAAYDIAAYDAAELYCRGAPKRTRRWLTIPPSWFPRLRSTARRSDGWIRSFNLSLKTILRFLEDRRAGPRIAIQCPRIRPRRSSPVGPVRDLAARGRAGSANTAFGDAVSPQVHGSITATEYRSSFCAPRFPRNRERSNPTDCHDRSVVQATWNRRLRGVHILAFMDRSYFIEFGADHKPPWMTLGWSRWRPNGVRFPRRSRRA